MTKERIIDMHAHVFPEKIAEKATLAISAYYGVPMASIGTVENLIRQGALAGIKRFLIHSTATNPDQVRTINEYIAATVKSDKRFWGFGTLHPFSGDIGGDGEHLASLGLLGVKVHPEFQNFTVDDEDVFSLYRFCEGRLPILVHMGDENKDSSSPERLARVLDRFPRLTVIAAHMGGYMRWDEAERCLVGREVFFDTSSSLWKMEPELAVRFIRAHGAERILFGTDFPMWNHAEELKRFLNLGLTEAEEELILYKNTERLLGL